MEKMTLKAFLLLFCLLTGVTLRAQVGTQTIDGLKYVFSEYGEATVSAENTSIEGEKTILEELTYNGLKYRVKNIANRGFENCSKLTSISMPASVLSIFPDAFKGCSQLATVHLSESLRNIGSYAFSGCSRLASIELPESLFEIGEYAFNDCSSLLIVRIPAKLVIIPNHAFAGCEKLTSVNIPASVRSILNFAFDGCTGLQEFTVDENNPNYTAVEGVLFSKDKKTIIAYPNAKSSSYLIPDNVETIGDNTFTSCKGLVSVGIPAGVSNIGYGAFAGCTKLDEIQVAAENVNYLFHEGVLYSKDKTEILAHTNAIASDYSMPEEVKIVGNYAFKECKKMTSVKMSQNLSDIKEGAFMECSGLTSVVIPNSVKTVGESAFFACSELKDFTLSKNVNPFISGHVLYGCNKLSKMNLLYTDPPKLGTYPMGKVYENCLLYVPFKTKAKYQEKGYFMFKEIVDRFDEEVEMYYYVATTCHGDVSLLINGRAVTNDTIKEGTKVEFKIIPPENQFISNVLLNNESVISQLEENVLTIDAIDKDLTLGVWVNYSPSSVNGMENESFKVYTVSGKVIIDNVEDSAVVSVCDVSGQTVYTGTDREIELDGGVYFIKIGEVIQKVSVR